jgi:RNA polymerase sigma-70 factor (ECF subfamily)
MSLGEDFEGVLAAAQTGADWALTSLYQDLHASVLRYLGANDRAEAEDLASDVWLDAARGLTRFHGGEHDFRKWLFTIARRRLLDHRRRTARRRTHPVPSEHLHHLPDPGDVEAEAIDTVEAQDAIVRVVDILSAEQAEVVILRVVGGLTADEAGAVMDKRPGAIRVLQHRALERLARELGTSAVTDRSAQSM